MSIDGSVEVLSWDDVSDDVMGVNAVAASIINEIAPDDSFIIYKAKYPYGANIVQAGKFNLPAEIGHASQIKEDLEMCNDLPLGFIMRRSIEGFINVRNQVIPFFVGHPGTFTSLWRSFDIGTSFQSLFPWNITAGARSVFLLPKITDSICHRKLQKALNLKLLSPESLEGHWNNFTKIFHKDTSQDWDTEILFFSKKWVDSILHDSRWQGLKCFLLNRAWEDSKFWRNEMSLDLVLNRFVQQVKSKGLKIKPKILAMLKRIIIIALGVFPGFVPAVNNELLPLDLLQDVYLNLYKLDKYIPTIMVPTTLGIQNYSQPVYYSLQWDMLLEPFMEHKTTPNIISILEEMDNLLHLFKQFICAEHDTISIDDTPLKRLKNTKFQCFHNSQSYVKTIYYSEDVLSQDDRFLFCKCNTRGKLCHAGQFVRGCIKIEQED